ncbi:hypothetical protein [Nitratidesulfovibrio termitidis]|uniref:hypothetical protein n=1 Tax=Nitratidesulfovibrio termitidis TaxID=42252 RepID=UPI0012EBE78A|nr:hypothetical protein [Nitratidesulfovibrio termitidis]
MPWHLRQVVARRFANPYHNGCGMQTGTGIFFNTCCKNVYFYKKGIESVFRVTKMEKSSTAWCAQCGEFIGNDLFVANGTLLALPVHR